MFTKQLIKPLIISLGHMAVIFISFLWPVSGIDLSPQELMLLRVLGMMMTVGAIVIALTPWLVARPVATKPRRRLIFWLGFSYVLISLVFGAWGVPGLMEFYLRQLIVNGIGLLAFAAAVIMALRTVGWSKYSLGRNLVLVGLALFLLTGLALSLITNLTLTYSALLSSLPLAPLLIGWLMIMNQIRRSATNRT